jgi:hypothetical protein
MKSSEITSLETNGAKYSSVTISGHKNQYTFTRVAGKYNYVAILKMNNPYKTLGKQFESFDKAQEAYRLPELKTMILLAESLLA